MRNYVKLASICLMLVMLLIAPAFAATTNPVLAMTGSTVAPVASVTATTASAPLMPGDTGTVAVTITNTLKAVGAGNTSTHTASSQYQYYNNGSLSPGITQTVSDQTTTSEGSSGAAAIKFVNLISEGPVHVLNNPYNDVGSLGLGDSMTLQFTVKVDSTAADGKYYLPIKVKTDNDNVFVNQVVPVVVDSTQPKMVLNDAPSKLGTSKSNIIIDVVNYRSNGITSASVVPEGAEFSFKPRAEYTVGNIGANEMYTVTFETTSKNATYTGSPSFVLKYKNGDNWHQTAPMVVAVDAKTDASAASAPGAGNDNTMIILIVAIVLVLIVIGGIYLFMRSQRAKK